LRRNLSFVIGIGLSAGCALRGDVRRVELQVASLKEDVRGGDAARKAQIDSLLALVAAVQQALAVQQAYLVQMRGDARTDLLSVQQQLVAIQELTGQSQQRLTDLRGRLDAQARQPVPPVENANPTGAPVGPSGNPAGPGPDQMYDLSLQQYRRGSLGTARLGFREFLRVYATDERAPDALFYIGETFAPENPDSAAAVYQQVVKTYPNSLRASSALYKLGLLAESRGNKAAARTYYQRVVAGYPRSDEANLARDKLQRLGR
jgi:tol-pal system protein YbgF